MSLQLLDRVIEAANSEVPPQSPKIEDAKIKTDFLDRHKVRHTFDDDPDEEWTTQKVLGRGGFGTVVLQKCTAGDEAIIGELRAVKKIAVGNSPSGNTQLLLERELQGLITFSDPQHQRYFVKFHGWFWDDLDSTVHLAMEYMPKGDLASHLETNGPLSGVEVKRFARQIFQALKYLHSRGFAHRDIKPQNILMASQRRVKLGDLSLSREFALPWATSSDVMGTRGFQAPELLHLTGTGSLSQLERAQKADMWAACESVARLLTQRPTFGNTDRLSQYVNGEITLEQRMPEFVSENAVEFLQTMMAPSPTLRPSVELLLDHSWLRRSEGYTGPDCHFRAYLEYPANEECPHVTPFADGSKVTVWHKGSDTFEVFSVEHPRKLLGGFKLPPGVSIYALSVCPTGGVVVIATLREADRYHSLYWIRSDKSQIFWMLPLMEPPNVPELFQKAVIAVLNSGQVAYGYDGMVTVFDGPYMRPSIPLKICDRPERVIDVKAISYNDQGALGVVTTHGVQLHVEPFFQPMVRRFAFPELDGIGAVFPNSNLGGIFVSHSSGKIYRRGWDWDDWDKRNYRAPRGPVQHLSCSTNGLKVVAFFEDAAVYENVLEWGEIGTFNELPMGTIKSVMLGGDTLIIVQKGSDGLHRVALYDYGYYSTAATG